VRSGPSFITTFDKIVTTMEDIGLSGFGTAEGEGSMLPLAGAIGGDREA